VPHPQRGPWPALQARLLMPTGIPDDETWRKTDLI
jgi:hypothetical protein